MILGIGTPILDYTVRVENSFVDSLPGKKGGMVPVTSEQFDEILKSSHTHPLIMAGGSCSNAIKGLASLGFDCALLGIIGHDTNADEYYAQIRALGITPLFQTSSVPTAKVLCLITPDGQRTCRSYLGASQEIDVNAITPDLFQNKKLVHIEGYSLLQGQLPELVMQLAKDAGALISFDLASFEIVEQFKDRIRFLLSNYVDILFANEDETQALTGHQGEIGCQELAKLARIAVVMQGSKGCLVGSKDELLHELAIKVNVVDTTGAGDYFASGFLGAYLQNKSLRECAASGNKMAAKVVQVFGTNIP
jgi:sugar/nucleoside kinase (ribokinase family)